MKLTAAEIRRAVRAALAEDIGSGDATTLATVPANATIRAAHAGARTARRAGTGFRRGLRFANFRQKSKSRKFLATASVSKPATTLLKISGPARALLSAERVALNFVQRLSGVAT